MATTIDPQEVLFDWNKEPVTEGVVLEPCERPELDDETLRDGVQGVVPGYPSTEHIDRWLEHCVALGIDTVNAGLPVPGPGMEQIEHICRWIADRSLQGQLAVNVACLTGRQFVEPLSGIVERTGVEIEPMIFYNSSPLSLRAAGESPQQVADKVGDVVEFAVNEGRSPCSVLEDTTRAPWETIRTIWTAAIGSGAERICACDTVGHAIGRGVRALVSKIRKWLVDEGHGYVKLDWHGHNDCGLGVGNTLEAILAGVDRGHATAFCIGERAGNGAMDQLVINLKRLDIRDIDLTCLSDYVHGVAEMVGMDVPWNYPGVGEMVFTTHTGVHASFEEKAAALGGHEVAEWVYTAFPASWLGRHHDYRIGWMSGLSNARLVARRLGIHEDPKCNDDALQLLVDTAKEQRRILSDDDIRRIVGIEGVEV